MAAASTNPPPPPPTRARRTLPLVLAIGAAGLVIVGLGVSAGFALNASTQNSQTQGAATEPVVVIPHTRTTNTPTGAAEPIESTTEPAPPGRRPPSGAFVEVAPGALALPDWDGVHFISPSGNLGCAITAEGALWGCAIVEKRWAFESDTPDDYCYDSQVPCGQGIEASHDGLPHPRERGDPGFPAAIAINNGGTDGLSVLAVLQYGQSVTYGDVTCYSESIAVTCHNHASGHGFVIARDRNDIY